MSEKESTKTVRTRPRWAAWCLVLAAIGGATAWANAVRLCWNDHEGFSCNGGQFASHQAQAVCGVIAICQSVPNMANTCLFCMTYDTLFLQAGQWLVYDAGQTGTLPIPCGIARRYVWSSTYNPIANGWYWTAGKLYDGACDDPNKLLVAQDGNQWQVNY